MKKKLILFIFFACSLKLFSLPIMYAEHYYRLYHLNLYRYPEDYLENLFYLELALEMPFANPLNAIARVETEKENEYYQYLFKMHCNLKMVENFRYLGSKFDKQNAYWFNAPFKEINLKGLKKAKEMYEQALYYWEEAKKWSALAYKFQYMTLDEVQFWMDECWRIENDDLNYDRYIQKDLRRVAQVQAKFEAMDETTFPLLKDEIPLNRFFKRRSIEEIRKDNDSKPYPPRK